MSEFPLAQEKHTRLIKIIGVLSALLTFISLVLGGENFLTWLLIAMILLAALILIYSNLQLSVAAFLGIFLVIQQPLESVFMFAKYGDEVIALLLLVMALIKNQKIIGKFQWRKTPIDLYIIGFIVLSLTSALVNQVPAEVAARGLYATLKGIVMFYTIWILMPEIKSVDRFVSFMETISVLLCLIAIVQFIGRWLGFGSTVTGWANLGITSIFVHRANFAYFVAFFSSFTFAQLVIDRQSLGKSLRRFLVMIIGILLAISRATWLALAASLFIHSLLIRSRKVLATSLVIVILLTLGIAIAVFNSDLLRANLAQKISGYTLAYQHYIVKTYPSYRGVDYRMIGFFEGLRVLKDHIVLGVGPGRYGGWVAYEYNSPVYETYSIPILGSALRQSDNFWIHLLVESGVPGFLMFLLILISIYKRCLQIFRQSTDKSIRRLALGEMIAFVLILIVGFFSPILEGSPMPFYFWSSAGAVLLIGYRTATPNKLHKLQNPPSE
jgi:O-antigen ligase